MAADVSINSSNANIDDLPPLHERPSIPRISLHNLQDVQTPRSQLAPARNYPPSIPSDASFYSAAQSHREFIEVMRLNEIALQNIKDSIRKSQAIGCRQEEAEEGQIQSESEQQYSHLLEVAMADLEKEKENNQRLRDELAEMAQTHSHNLQPTCSAS